MKKHDKNKAASFLESKIRYRENIRKEYVALTKDNVEYEGIFEEELIQVRKEIRSLNNLISKLQRIVY